MDRLLELLDRLDYTIPGMEAAGRLYHDKKYEECMAATAEHFRTRTSPGYLFTAEDLKQLDDPLTLTEAGEVMEHRIYGHHFEGEIDWFFNPTDETSRDNEWSWSLYRHVYWQPLARAYALTGDEAYTEEFLHQLNSFADSWPLRPFLEDTDGSYEKQFDYPGHPWRPIETAMRIYTSWLPCMEAFRASSAWQWQDWARFLILVCDHADHLVAGYTNHTKSSNWLTMESGAALQCGIMFPEIRSDWKSMGYRRVMYELKYSFDHDGIHMERTPIYHMVAAGSFLQCWRLCRINRLPVPPYGLPTLVRAAEFLMSLVKPDFSTPMIGDADRVDLQSRRCDTSLYEGMNLTMDPFDLNEMRAYFRTMHELTGRDDFLYFAAGRKAGSTPAKRNFQYPAAGIYVMRTGWEAEDSYLLVHGIQLERGEVSTHSHNDTGHLEIHIKGEDILTDSGRYIYNKSCWKDWRHYFLSARAHNTLYVDDHEMGAVPGVSRTRGVRTCCHRFEENGDYQLIDISHNGYVYTDDPIYHRRRVLRLAGDVYVIDDQVTGPGLCEHDIRLYFNFSGGVLSEKADGVYGYTSEKGRNYQLTGLASDRVETEMLYGSEDPIGGWISHGYAWRKPIPQLAVKTRGPVPVRFITVLAPAVVTVSGTVSMDEVSLSFGGGAVSEVNLSGESIAII